MSTAPLVNGFLLGLSTGPLCMLTCVPLTVPFALGLTNLTVGATGRPRPARAHTWAFLGKFLLGRLVAYAAVGLAAGLAASRLGPAQRKAAVVVWIALSVLLVAYGLSERFRGVGLCRLAGRLAGRPLFPLVLGLLAGLSVCPPFLLAIAYALESGSQALAGLSFFLAFFVATTLYVLPIGLLGYLPKKPMWERLGRLAAVAAGVVFLVQGVIALRA